LIVRDLDVHYGPLQAVRGLSFRVDEGQTVTLLGANGAGKTSVIRAICGLVPVRGRSLEYGGRTLNGLRPDERVVRGIATVPEGRDLFRSLTVEENLRMGAYRRRHRAGIAADLAWIYDLFPVLGTRRRQHAGTLSGGQGQMLAIGRALMAAPRLLLLDEPSHGLAPLVVEEIFQLIVRLHSERTLSILLVEQNASKALTAASYGYVLEAGSLALEGPTERLQHDARVRALYLGGDKEAY
jgi:branched-chain amino acid transport system ATP-binding protein